MVDCQKVGPGPSCHLPNSRIKNKEKTDTMTFQTPDENRARLQGHLAIASFSCGVLIAAACLFIIPPLGEIANSAISIVSELLVLTGALLGIKTSFDIKMRKFQDEIDETRRKMDESKPYNDEEI